MDTALLAQSAEAVIAEHTRAPFLCEVDEGRVCSWKRHEEEFLTFSYSGLFFQDVRQLISYPRGRR